MIQAELCEPALHVLSCLKGDFRANGVPMSYFIYVEVEMMVSIKSTNKNVK